MTAVAFTLRIRHMSGTGLRREYSFDQDSVSIGRARENDVPLLNRHRAVSRRHAEIRRFYKAFQLIDLGSKNVTRINGQRLEPGCPQSLQDGDRLSIGDFELEFVLSESARSYLKQPLPGPQTLAQLQTDPGSVLAKIYGGSRLRHGLSAPRALDELLLLCELAFEVAALFDVREIMNTMLRYAIRAVEAQHGMITLAKAQTPSAAQLCTRVGDAEGFSSSIEDSLFHWMRDHKTPLRFPASQGLVIPEVPAMSEAVQAMLCLPMLVGTRLTGMLMVFHKREGATFSAVDERLLALMATQMAPVLESAKSCPHIHLQSR